MNKYLWSFSSSILFLVVGLVLAPILAAAFLAVARPIPQRKTP